MPSAFQRRSELYILQGKKGKRWDEIAENKIQCIDMEEAWGQAK